MQKMITRVPAGTIPKSIGKNYMACIFDDDGKLCKCTNFFASWDEASEFAKKYPEYQMYGASKKEPAAIQKQ